MTIFLIWFATFVLFGWVVNYFTMIRPRRLFMRELEKMERDNL